MKKFKRLVSIFCTLFLLTGCFKVDMGFDIKSAEEMDVSVTLLLSPDLINGLSGLGESEEQSEPTDEEVVEVMKEGTASSTAEYKYVEKEVNGVLWRGVTITENVPKEEAKKYLKIVDHELVFTVTKDDLSDYENFLGEGEEEEDDVIEGTTIIEQEDFAIDGLEESLQEFKETGAEMTLRITMPKEPTTNIGTVDGKTVTIDLMSEEYNKFAGESIVVRCQNSINYMDYVPVACVGFLCVFCILGIILVNRSED